MAYIGRPTSAEVSVTGSTDTFTGDGNVAFNLSRVVTDGNASLLEVFVSNVQQQPIVTFSVASNVLTFTSAPGVGEPIYVIYRDYPVAPVFTIPNSSITDIKIGAGAVTETKIAAFAVTETKIASAAVTESKIGTSAITDSKIQANAVTTTKILDGAVTAAKLGITSDVSFGGANLDYAGLGGATVSSSSNVVTLNFQTAASFTCNLTEESTLTPNNVPAGGCVMILKLENGGDHTVTYAGNARFAANTAPTLTASGLDYLFFICDSNDSYLVTAQTDVTN